MSTTPWKVPKLTGDSWGSESDWMTIALCPHCLYVLFSLSYNRVQVCDGELQNLNKGWSLKSAQLHYCTRCGTSAQTWVYEHDKNFDQTVWNKGDLLLVVARFRRPGTWWFKPWTWSIEGYWEIREADWDALRGAMEPEDSTA